MPTPLLDNRQLGTDTARVNAGNAGTVAGTVNDIRGAGWHNSASNWTVGAIVQVNNVKAEWNP